MAIEFARMNYVGRKTGGNSCLKSAYNNRSKLKDERTGKTYSFESRGGNVFSEIFLPERVSDRFKEASVLWNAVEKMEKRPNSQVAKEIVLALPDNKEIGLEDRIELCRRFVEENFTKKGLAVQIDIHEPHHKRDKNWHAHLLVTTRRFREDGESLGQKARDLDAIVRKGKVVEGEKWGRIWRDVQNSYFKEKGLDIRVDAIGIVPQEHLGPVRMRRHMSESLRRNGLIQVANQDASLEAGRVIDGLTRTSSAFREEDVFRYVEKHVEEGLREEMIEEVMSHREMVSLYDKETGEKLPLYTTKTVRSEEEKIIRLAERVNGGSIVDIPSFFGKGFKFSEEQKKAGAYMLDQSHGLRILQGRAGTGKSYVLSGVRTSFEKNGMNVIGLAPTTTVVRDLKDNGFDKSYTVHDFLFRQMNGRLDVEKGSVLIIDEAGMIGNRPLLELLKVASEMSCKVILAGDDRQLSSVERGGMFKVLSERFGSVELSQVYRQRIDWQRQVAEDLSQGKVSIAVNSLDNRGHIHWSSTQEESLSELLKIYSSSVLEERESSISRLILAHRNVEVDILNRAIQEVMQAAGQVETKEYVCQTIRGEVSVAVGDRVQFIQTDKKLDLVNGEFGKLIQATEERFDVKTDRGRVVSFNPSSYGGLRLGYASTIYKGQGKTIDEVHVLHSPYMSQNLSYVALTRQTKDVRLYVSTDQTKNTEELIAQMGRQENRITTLAFQTEQEKERAHLVQQSVVQRFSYAVGDHVRSALQHFTDTRRDASFYKLPPQKEFEGGIKRGDAIKRWDEEGLGKDGESVKDDVLSEIKLKDSRSVFQRYDIEKIEAGLKGKVREFSIHLLGSPDLKYSTSTELCFKTEYGKTFINTETGLWYDFKTSEGGNLFDLIQRRRGGGVKDSLSYAAFYLGYEKETLPSKVVKLSKDSREKEVVSVEKSQESEQKIEKAQSVYENAQQVEGSIAERYLREHRGIEGRIPSDLRFLNGYYNSETKTQKPALLSFMRNKEGTITGYQATYLDPLTGKKARVETAKKSAGIIKGSFVEIQRGQGAVYLAEGVETALSLKESGIEGSILAGLGISNLKNYDRDEKNIILCADNDGVNSISSKTIEKTRTILEEKGYNVCIVYPTGEGKDFNDILLEKGKDEILKTFQRISFSETTDSRGSTEKFSISEGKPASSVVEKDSLQILEDLYRQKITELYKEKLGDKAGKYEKEIDSIAFLSAKEVIIKNKVLSKDEEVILFAQNQHYIRRMPQIQKIILENDSSKSWIKTHVEANYVASIESRLYGEERSKSSVVSSEALKEIEKKAFRKFTAVPDRIQHYEEKFKKEGMTDPHQLHFLSRQAVLFEAKMGQIPNENQLNTLKEAASVASTLYAERVKEHSNNLIKAGHSTTGSNNDLIDLVAKYRVHQEMSHIYSYILSKGQIPSSKELCKYAELSLEKFNSVRDAYMKQEKNTSIQKTPTPSRTKDTGMEL